MRGDRGLQAPTLTFRARERLRFAPARRYQMHLRRTGALAHSQPLPDEDFQLPGLLPAESFRAPNDVIAFVDEKDRGEIADAELGSDRTGVLVAAHEHAIVDPIALARAPHFHDLILGRNIAFVID